MLAGFERLNNLLPESWSPAQRHQYLRKRIIGSDTDAFAREVAVLSLLLTDLHNRNGWDVRDADLTTFAPTTFSRRPTIIVTNPPFREIKEGVRREFAAEVLMRLIDGSATGALLGVVLPQSILETSAGRDARKAVLEKCDLLELAILPGGLFYYSNADTALLLLRRRQQGQSAQRTAAVRELRAQDLGRFEQAGTFTRTYAADLDEWRNDPNGRFIASPLSALWRRFAEVYTPFETIADVWNGLQMKQNDRSSVSSARRSGDVPFVDRLNVLKPFALLVEGDTAKQQWLKYGPQLHRPRDKKIFEAKKVLVNATSNPGSPWRLVAAPALAGLYFGENFHGIIPRVGTKIETLVAILNSPVANAWLDAHTRRRKILVRTLESSCPSRALTI